MDHTFFSFLSIHKQVSTSDDGGELVLDETYPLNRTYLGLRSVIQVDMRYTSKRQILQRKTRNNKKRRVIFGIVCAGIACDDIQTRLHSLGSAEFGRGWRNWCFASFSTSSRATLTFRHKISFGNLSTALGGELRRWLYFYRRFSSNPDLDFRGPVDIIPILPRS